MQVIVKGRNTHVPEHVRELAVRKIEKVRRFFDRIQKLEIEFSEERNPRVAARHEVEVTLTTKAHLIRAHAAAADAASAVDSVVDKLEAQVKRLKDKRASRARRGPRGPAGLRGVPVPLNNPVEFTDNPGTEDGGTEDGGGRITLRRRFPAKPMTPEEAILELEELGQGFLAFIRAENDQPCVVYRRGDGSFGLIEPV